VEQFSTTVRYIIAAMMAVMLAAWPPATPGQEAVSGDEYEPSRWAVWEADPRLVGRWVLHDIPYWDDAWAMNRDEFHANLRTYGAMEMELRADGTGAFIGGSLGSPDGLFRPMARHMEPIHWQTNAGDMVITFLIGQRGSDEVAYRVLDDSILIAFMSFVRAAEK
jgi:hypothetical protein